jgi:hypothetical protein
MKRPESFFYKLNLARYMEKMSAKSELTTTRATTLNTTSVDVVLNPNAKNELEALKAMQRRPNLPCQGVEEAKLYLHPNIHICTEK